MLQPRGAAIVGYSNKIKAFDTGGSVLMEFPGFPVLANPAVVDCELLAEPQFFCIHHGLVVQCAKHQLTFFITAVYSDPHPFTGQAVVTTVELHLDVVTVVIPSHMTPLSPHCR